jgi:DNA processing protein
LVELSPADRRTLIAKAQSRQGILPLNAENSTSGTTNDERTTTNELSIYARKLLNTLRPDTPTHLDALLETFDVCSSSETIAALFELEMTGLARQLPGKNFVRVW